MEKEKLLKIVGAIFLMRAEYYRGLDQFWMSVAYDDAFDMLAYAATGNWDCLSQFGWSDDAEYFINKVGADIDFWDLEDLIKKELS